MTDADRDLMMMILVAFAEASDQGQDGIRAQAHSVLNRYRAKKWYSGRTIAETIMMPYAYSAMNTDDQNRRRAMREPMDSATMTLCIGEVIAAIGGATEDPTDGATHYYAAGTREPDWVSGAGRAPPAIFCKQIGGHLFFKGVA